MFVFQAVTSADALCPVSQVPGSLQSPSRSELEAEEQMSKTSPSKDQGPSLASEDNTPKHSEGSTAPRENTPDDQV